MSEYPTINLLLGIIGTITGLFALFISLWSYWREKPKLKMEIIKSKHNYTHNPSEKQELNLWADFQVKNLGDRGTRINDVVLSFNNKISLFNLVNSVCFNWISVRNSFDSSADCL